MPLSFLLSFPLSTFLPKYTPRPPLHTMAGSLKGKDSPDGSPFPHDKHAHALDTELIHEEEATNPLFGGELT